MVSPLGILAVGVALVQLLFDSAGDGGARGGHDVCTAADFLVGLGPPRSTSGLVFICVVTSCSIMVEAVLALESRFATRNALVEMLGAYRAHL